MLKDLMSEFITVYVLLCIQMEDIIFQEQTTGKENVLCGCLLESLH